MAILTPIPPTPGGQSDSSLPTSPATPVTPITPATPPHLTSAPTKASASDMQASMFGDLLDLDFADSDTLSSVLHPSTALVKRQPTWDLMVPDMPKAAIPPEAIALPIDTEIKSEQIAEPVQDSRIADATSQPPEDGVKEESDTDSTPTVIPLQTPVRSPSLNVAARPFQASAFRSPPTFYSSDSDASDPTHVAEHHSRTTSIATDDMVDDTAEWAMQQGFGGFGHIPSPTPTTPAPVPMRSLTASYHSMPHSKPVRITSPPRRMARTAPGSRTIPACKSASPDRTPTAQVSSDIAATPGTPTKCPETLLAGLTGTLSTASLQSITEQPATPTPNAELKDQPCVKTDQEEIKVEETAEDRTTVGAAWKQGLDEIKDLDECWQEVRQALSRFGGGLDEAVVRLQDVMANHVCDPIKSDDDLASIRSKLHIALRALDESREARRRLEKELVKADLQRVQLEAQVGRAQAEADRATKTIDIIDKREAVWRNSNDKLRADNDRLHEDQRHWHKREQMLADDFVSLEDAYRALLKQHKKQGTEPSVPFAVVMLEVTADLIDTDIIKQGEKGGSTLAKDLHDRVQACAGTPEVVLVQLFMDTYTLAKKWRKDGTIKREEDIHRFLDGIRDENPLYTAIDCSKPSRVLREHLELYAKMGATVVLLGATQNEALMETVKRLDKKKPRILRFIQTSRDPNKDEWATVDASRLIHVKSITPPNAASHRAHPASRASTKDDSTIETPVPRQPIPDRIAKSVDTLVTPSDSVSSVGFAAPMLYSEERHAPWATTDHKKPSWRAQLPSPPPRDDSPVPYWEKGGCLLDELNNAKARHSSDGGRTPRAVSPPPRGLNIRVGRDDGSLAGSPPDSDEDTPSVPLPHSALKHVQRPTPVEKRGTSSNASAASTRPEVAAAAAAYAARRTRQISVSEEKLHGFKIHSTGRKSWAERK